MRSCRASPRSAWSLSRCVGGADPGAAAVTDRGGVAVRNTGRSDNHGPSAPSRTEVALMTTKLEVNRAPEDLHPPTEYVITRQD